ncbi:MAG: InlB B-repeat-containing protein [Solirubrobacterales bacterium]
MRRLIILLAALGALLVAPAAHAAPGVEPVKVTLNGTGAGKAFIPPGLEFYAGSPEIKCTYASPGPQAGVCETKMSNEGAGWEQVFIQFEASPGSKLTSVTAANVEVEACGNFPGSETEGICTPYVEPPETGSGEAEITATFEDEPGEPLIVAIEEGTGTVVSNPAGIECIGSAPKQCWKSYTSPTKVALTASPASGYAFSSWSGCTSVNGRECIVEKAGEGIKKVKVKFIKTWGLTVEKAGTGYGKVGATGISCDESCSKANSAVKAGTAVTVKATPAKGSEFVGFEGGTGSASGCSGATCAFPISQLSSVKAKFVPLPTKTLTVKITGPGAYKGKVSGKGTTVKGVYSTAISCGSGCTSAIETFFASGTTELVASTGVGYKFAGWTVSGGTAGTCEGTTSPCTLLTDANKTVEAKFE